MKGQASPFCMILLTMSDVLFMLISKKGLNSSFLAQLHHSVL